MGIFYGPWCTFGHMYIAVVPAQTAWGQPTKSKTVFITRKFVLCLKADEAFLLLFFSLKNTGYVFIFHINISLL